MKNHVRGFIAVAVFLLAATNLRASDIPACGVAPLPKGIYQVSSRFGMRLHPLSKAWQMHRGVDLACPTGTPVSAVGDGIVLFAGRWGCYGKVVVLRHSGDVVTLYAHLSQVKVRRGWPVRQGEVIGAVGATGCVTGSHLHFELWMRSQRVNPLARCAALRVPEVKQSWPHS
jgi:murein DD-endopeptidase MepM/ murein hydrolase activator NlpD